MKIKNMLNAHEFATKGELNTLPSLAIPDQAMTMQELLDRQARGIPMVGEKFPIYYGEEDILPDFRHMDLADIQEHREMLAERIQQQREELAAQDEERKREDIQKWDDLRRDIIASTTQFFKRKSPESEKPDSFDETK